MNIYVVTEGETEAIVYRNWIPLVNPLLEPVDTLNEVHSNNFFIVSGKGYPFYFNIIEDAIADVNELALFDRLVICADSEDVSHDEKYSEIHDFTVEKPCIAPIKIVVQHFCIEAWALGNRRIIRPHPTSLKLREYKALFDVRLNDPELLPACRKEELNRAQFAEKYLRHALNDKFQNLTYTKKNPKALLHPKYFEQLCERLKSTMHISSFSSFLESFK